MASLTARMASLTARMVVPGKQAQLKRMGESGEPKSNAFTLLPRTNSTTHRFTPLITQPEQSAHAPGEIKALSMHHVRGRGAIAFDLAARLTRSRDRERAVVRQAARGFAPESFRPRPPTVVPLAPKPTPNFGPPPPPKCRAGFRDWVPFCDTFPTSERAGV
eukprot:713289-Rhodomonas_salina.1